MANKGEDFLLLKDGREILCTVLTVMPNIYHLKDKKTGKVYYAPIKPEKPEIPLVSSLK